MASVVLTLILFLTLVQLSVSPPVPRRDETPVVQESSSSDDHLTAQQAQDQEYFRYLTQVITELEKDEKFKEKLANVTDEDIRSGKLAEHMDLVGHGVRQKLDEVKRVEVEYQRELLRQKKHHMAGSDRNYWNPIHQKNKDTFEREDLFKLLSKHNDMMEEQDAKRKEDFKKYELEKEHKRREGMKNMTEKEKNETVQLVLEKKNKKHEKMHEPGHKAQLEEVWEDEDGLDKDSFDPKTFFNLHDKNSDGYLDQFELKTLFLHDIDKVYNESDPDTDPVERAEEMERMREHVMKTMDKDKDGLLSMAEFIQETESEDFEKDDEWSPITDEDQYTEEELDEYEKQLEKEDQEAHEGELHEKHEEETESKSHGDEAGKKEEEKQTKEEHDVESGQQKEKSDTSHKEAVVEKPGEHGGPPPVEEEKASEQPAKNVEPQISKEEEKPTPPDDKEKIKGEKSDINTETEDENKKDKVEPVIDNSIEKPEAVEEKALPADAQGKVEPVIDIVHNSAEKPETVEEKPQPVDAQDVKEDKDKADGDSNLAKENVELKKPEDNESGQTEQEKEKQTEQAKEEEHIENGQTNQVKGEEHIESGQTEQVKKDEHIESGQTNQVKKDEHIEPLKEEEIVKSEQVQQAHENQGHQEKEELPHIVETKNDHVAR